MSGMKLAGTETIWRNQIVWKQDGEKQSCGAQDEGE